MAIALVVFPAGGTDDSYITFWAARSLARTGEILNYNGAALEQSSSLLHTLVLAGVAWLTGWSVPLVGHLVAPLGGVAAVVATVALARRVESRAALLAGVLAATSSYLAFWTFGGMETTLATAALAGAVLACAVVAAGPSRRRDWAHRRDWPHRRNWPHRRPWMLATAAIVAAVLVRPEGGLVLGAALAGAGVVELAQARRGRAGRVERAGTVRAGTGRDGTGRGGTGRTGTGRTGTERGGAGGERQPGAAGRLLVLLGITAAVLALSMLGRLVAFGEPFPHPVAAKTSDLVASEGWLYVAKWWLSRFQVPVLVVAGAGAILATARRLGPAATLAATTVVALTGFVLTSGGDWMQAGRFLVPAIPFLAVLAAAAIVALPWWRVAAVALVAVQVVGVVDLARHRSTTTPLWAESTFDVSPEVEQRFAWFELRNRVHLRNAALYVQAEDVVEGLLATSEGPVTISGVQAGLTIYSLFEEHAGELRFIDRHTLVSDDFARCEELLQPSFRGLGAKMGYEEWFANVDECGVGLPDVAIEYDTLADHPGLPGRYTVVASVPDVANHAASRLPGIDVGTAQFVAVRNDLLPRLGAS